MMRKRSGMTMNKPAQKADYSNLQSPIEEYRKPVSTFFGSPRIFTGFASKGFSDSESLTSPTSILDSKPFSALRNPFWSDSITPKTPKGENKVHWDKFEARGGLGLVDVLTESDSKLSKRDSPTVVFGSQLKIQNPSLLPSVTSPVDSPRSPAEFGIKTRNSKVGLISPGVSPSAEKRSPFGSSNSGLDISNSGRFFSCLSLTEMELSEDYTRVISHGPNPKTTHIFDDCIVGSWHGDLQLPSRKETERFLNRSLSFPPESFLSFCHNCKKNLGQGKDIYMYRGEKAFCSSDCRNKEMMLEEATEITALDDDFDVSPDKISRALKGDQISA